MLDPGGGILVAPHLLLVGQLEEGEDVVVPGIEEDVHVGIVLAGGGHVVLGEGGGVVHAHHAGVPLDRFLGVAAAIGDVMNAGEGEGVGFLIRHIFTYPSSSRA